jgi:hypothetical protein
MNRGIILALVCAGALWMPAPERQANAADGAQAYGRQWGHTYNVQDWNRFYHYPYVYYPQNFWTPDYYKSSQSLYHRYPPQMGIPMYNKCNQNYYPMPRRYHEGHHFILDVF